MRAFASLLNQLYFTAGHLDKMALLQDFFAHTADPDRGYALAIIANTLDFPKFNRMLIKELIQEVTDSHLFELSYDYVGDMSETVALLWPNPQQEYSLPPLSELIHTFKKTAKSDIKNYLRDLLNRSNTYERWALLKLGTGSLRIGVSARFIKLSLAKYGNVTIHEIEKVWHGLQAPYIELFAWLEKKAPLPSIQESIYFHPVMLSHPLDDKTLAQLDTNQFAFEKKYDGIRIQFVSNGKQKALFTRTGDDISTAFPDALDLVSDSVILDGELVIHTDSGIGSFNNLQQRLNRKTTSKKMLESAPAAIILYDLLSWQHIDMRYLPFIERRKKLEQWFELHVVPNLLLSELLFLKERQTLLELKQQILDEQHPAVEGLMLKHYNSCYIAGRPRGQWFKWKRDPLLVDAVMMYAQRGHGKRSSYYSDFTFGLWEKEQLLPIGKAYSGFTDEELVLLDRWVRNNTIHRFGPVREVKKELVLEIAFDAVNQSKRHKSGLALRFPRINRIRWDKPSSEADCLQNLADLILH